MELQRQTEIKAQRRNFLIVISIALIYFLSFIPVNLRAAGDKNMLVCAGADEYNQFPVVLEMLAFDGGLGKTIMGIIDYGHYFYGSPFYFISFISLIPLKIYSKLSLLNNTRVYVLTLRQLSPLFMSFSILLLISLWTKFKNLWLSIFLFLYLGYITAVFINNTWWHPESMVTFFVVATIYFLYRDEFRYRSNFYFSSIFCALAITTKTAGLFFVFCILIYLIIGVVNQKLTIRESILEGGKFLGIMIVSIFLSHPILLIPGKAKDVFATIYNQSVINSFDWGLPFLQRPGWHYSATVKDGYGHWIIITIALAVGLYSTTKSNQYQLLNILIMSWSVPLLVYVSFFITRKNTYYFLPAFIPLFSVLWNPFFWERNKIWNYQHLSVDSVFFLYDL